MGRVRTGEDRNCEICSKKYYVPKWRLKRSPSRFCSVQCQNHGQYERPIFTCKKCEKNFESSPCRTGKKIFCSNECRFTWYAERKINVQKYRAEAINKVRKKGLLPTMGAPLRRYILENKEQKCHVCGYEEYKCCLDIHHIDHNPSNNQLENIAILCVMCHRKVHRKIIKI